ncbi:nitrate reductase molybdenum cofactor assembly chaperone [Goodfellowiella coeruleoviolacea]|uniref:Respiratory nitrate reductase chaperone NarJ n=1 Tax=Goodfellowiella coeruleoviolacea TaxID=334858 RepID=A0AAE3GG32_9PSEU|nr:nitrate reductase molybdenum cofactor assembly chaperone [Goodfellowiella coeruleoviolacea]MCP2167470.1 respiratory nitrate reductase chaperone NarJ [Goodfellowiella coeruleoviolacea]
MRLFRTARRRAEPATRHAIAAPRHRRVLRAVAGWCLQYPDHTVLDRLPLLNASLRELPEHTPGRTELDTVVAFLADTEPLALAEHYVEVFDRKPRRTLHLSWYADGDTRRRGASLAALRRFYREHGFAPAEDELPDFLPVLLEFAAQVRDPEVADRALAGFRAGLELLHHNLGGVETAYRDAVGAVLATLPAPPAHAAPAELPDAPGNLVEFVGLEPYPLNTGGTR